MWLLALLLFIVLPIAEIYVIIQVGEAIGVGATIVLLLLDGVLGTWVFKREGRRAWAALQEAIAVPRMPTKEVTDGALVVVGGAFLLAPGFITDVIGLLCVLPPSRAVLRRLLSGYVGRRLLLSGTPRRPWGGTRQATRPPRGDDRDDVIEGEVLSEEDDQPD